MRAAVALVWSLSACAHVVGPAPAVAPRTDASAGVDDGPLADLLERHWAWTMAREPAWAAALGRPGPHDRVADPSVAAAAAHDQAVAAFLAEANDLRSTAWSARDTRVLTLFRDQLTHALALSVCDAEQWSLSPRDNPMSELFSGFDAHRLDAPEDGEALLRRIHAWAAAVDAHIEALAAGKARGLVANATSVQLTVEMVRSQLDRSTSLWPGADKGASLEAPWVEGWRARWAQSMEDVVRPALTRYADFLQDQVLPQARGDEAPGLASLPVGEACYAARVASFTTLPLDAATLHQTGLEELARIHAEFVALGPSTVGADTLPGVFAALRSDPALRFQDAPGIVAKAQEALARAEAAVPAWFGTLPATPCVVQEVPAYEAPYTTIAYYRQPEPGGTKPGEYFVNTYAPDTRPRFEAEVLAFHESVPGHHLQIALSYEQGEVPAFHRYDGSTAFVEGWALYTERLADEMGLYSSDVDRLGMLSFDAWRAARLVVDTGLHHLGWSRAQAEQFMRDNTPLADNNIRNEVDRYITWPGQALAYKTGQLEIRRLRQQAEAALGSGFDIRAFHDVVLGQGAVSLPVLRDQVAAWVQASRKTPSP